MTSGRHWHHLKDLVGLDYKERGRGPDGYDCWGLICEAYDRIFGFSIPSYADRPDSTGKLARLAHNEQKSWVKVDYPKTGDLILFRGLPPHVGMSIGRGRMLHMPKDQKSCIESWREPLWQPRITGFFRHPRMVGARR